MSIRSICDKVHCNVSAISYHFGSKEELYQSCLKEEGQNVMAIINSVLTTPENKADFKAKLKLFLDQFFEHSYMNREAILIISKDVNSKSAMDSVHTIFNQIPEAITAFLREAQEKDIIRKDIEVEFLCNYLTNPIFMQVLFAEVSKSFKQKNMADPQARHDFVAQHIDILTAGIF